MWFYLMCVWERKSICIYVGNEVVENLCSKYVSVFAFDIKFLSIPIYFHIYVCVYNHKTRIHTYYWYLTYLEAILKYFRSYILKTSEFIHIDDRIYINVCGRLLTYLHVYIMYMCMYAVLCIYICIFMYIHIYVHTYIYVYTQTHINI